MALEFQEAHIFSGVVMACLECDKLRRAGNWGVCAACARKEKLEKEQLKAAKAGRKAAKEVEKTAKLQQKQIKQEDDKRKAAEREKKREEWRQEAEQAAAAQKAAQEAFELYWREKATPLERGDYLNKKRRKSDIGKVTWGMFTGILPLIFFLSACNQVIQAFIHQEQRCSSKFRMASGIILLGLIAAATIIGVIDKLVGIQGTGVDSFLMLLGIGAMGFGFVKYKGFPRPEELSKFETDGLPIEMPPTTFF